MQTITTNLPTVAGVYMLLFGLLMWLTCIIWACFAPKSIIPEDIGMGGSLCALIGLILLNATLGFLEGTAISAVIVAPAGLLACVRGLSGHLQGRALDRIRDTA